MRIHVIQTGTVAIKQVQRHGRTSGNPVVNILLDPNWTEPLPIYAFVIEHPEGLIVVDTGETARVAEPGYFPWWHPYFRFALREWVQPEEEIGSQMRALGMLRGFLPNRWPRWFHPTLIDMQPEPLGPFPSSYPITQAGDVQFVPTPGHTPGHLSVIVTTPDVTYVLAGDASYTQALMLAEQIDGVSNDRTTARRTLAQIHAFCRATPSVYMPTHDPDTPDRLANRQLAVAPATLTAVMVGAG